MKTAVVLALVAGAAWAQEEKLRVGAPVSVPIVVRDKKGDGVAGLGKDNFSIKVDGKDQPVTGVTAGPGGPVVLGLVVDVSDGERDNLERTKRAARALIDGLQPGDKMFVVQFARQIELLEEPTNDRAKLVKALNLLGTSSPTFNPHMPPDEGRDKEGRRIESGGNSLNDAVYLSCEEVLAREKGRRVLVVVSDGVDIRSKKSSTELVESIERTRAVVYTAYTPTKLQPREGQGNRGGQQGGNGGGSGRPSIGGWPGSTYPGSGSPTGGSGGGNSPNGQNKPTTGDREHRPNVDGTQVLAKLSRNSGGRFLSGERHDTLEDGMASIATDMKAMYWVEFTPIGPAARQAYHLFDLDVHGSDKGKKVELQAPDGYYAAS
ncbi:VWA domain-containing protein [Granulicella cerasi]|uniref:VWA domain-containing protein n=1 Tax=Granulicella cerasi TaxID=741063 RepID=A0ABW1Z9Y5_9BACT|nr:VWA domain-containing protein [Granulicella cerasi]